MMTGESDLTILSYPSRPDTTDDMSYVKVSTFLNRMINSR